MKFQSCLFWSFLALNSTAAVHIARGDPQSYTVPDNYIVVLRRGHSPRAVAHQHGIKPKFSYAHALNGFAGKIPKGRLRALLEDARVEHLEPDLHLVTTAQTLPTGVRRIGANASGVAKIDGLDERINVDIAVLDTGVAPHADLNVFTNVSFIYGQSTDANGHGTQVAGVAAALDNDYGVVGVAPGARLWSVKVIDDSGLSTTSWAIQGIDYVTQKAGQIEVANLSLSGIGYSYALRQAIINSVNKGVVYVVSAGNDGRDIYGSDGLLDTADDSIPAAYPEVMTVSALSDGDGVASGDDALANFSNYSRSVVPGNPVTSPGAAIDLAAPGVNIYSTYPGGGYATATGTSVAAPHVAGAVALYIARYGRATNAAGVAAIRQALVNSAQPQNTWGSANTLDPDLNNEGLVNAGVIDPPLNNPPTGTITSPTSGSVFTYGALISFSGTATDTEDGALTSSLVWTSSVDGQIGTAGSVSRTLSIGTHTITARVTDSGGKTAAQSIAVTVQAPPTNNPPAVAITAPETGSGFNSGVAILFAGAAIDSEDGNRTANLVWTSSIDGQIGSGGYLSRTLSPGTHVITASVTDSGGKTASDSITITVLAPLPTLLRVSVTTDKSSYVNRNKVFITATVTDGANRIAGAAAHLKIVTAKGTKISSDATTDSYGVARFQYRVNANRDGLGTHTATVSCSKNGYTSGSGTVAYEVR